jgi:putative endopeptidase
MNGLPTWMPVRGAVLALSLALPAAAQRRPVPPPAVDRALIDTSCAPCKDFFRYANGAWLDSVRIPPDQGSWGPQAELQWRNEAVLREIVDSLAYAPDRHARTALERKVGVFYRTCMDTSVTGAASLRALGPELRRIDAVASRAALSRAVARLHRTRATALFAFDPVDDARRPTETIGQIGPWGWALPARGYYVRADSAAARARSQYVAMLDRVFSILGDAPDSAAANAARVLRLETALARAAGGQEGADPRASYHRLTGAELRRLAPAFDWRAYFGELGTLRIPAVTVQDLPYMRAVDSLLTAVPPADWRAYLRWQLVRALAPSLKGAFGGVIGAFTASLSGVQTGPPASTGCVRQTNNLLGEGLGGAFVARAFSPDAKARSLALAGNVRAVLRERLTSLEWLGPATRRRAVAKLDALGMKIGYPDRGDDYATLEVADRPHVLNALAVLRFRSAREYATLDGRTRDEPGDRAAWDTPPSISDASYYKTANELLITAAYLQPPFFDPRAEDAWNYGAVGFTFGHELTHAFDNKGRRHDARGALDDWWTPEEDRRYTERAARIVDQYDGYVVVDSIRQNGRATLNENIADIGGLKLAYLAFARATRNAPREVVDGFTPEQRFFLAFAQSTFREATRAERLRLRAENDSHAAPRWRVNGPPSWMPEFAAAFGCKAGDAMVRPEAARGAIW